MMRKAERLLWSKWSHKLSPTFLLAFCVFAEYILKASRLSRASQHDEDKDLKNLNAMEAPAHPIIKTTTTVIEASPSSICHN
jgi:hypothetical protein